MIEKTQPIELLDLGSGIFESATVDSNILIFEKTLTNNKPFIGLDISKQKYFIDFTIFESHKVEISPKRDTVWSISSKHEQLLKNKFDAQGTQLNEWEIQIKYGIKTGLNEAFIVDENKKNELILKNIVNKELLVPILRGRDVSRYQTDYQNLHLINSHNGYKGVPKINIENYVDIKNHLEKFEPQLSKRYDKGDTSFNLRNCAYLEAFLQPKIIWKEMSSETPFVIDKNGYFTNDTITFIIGENLEYLLSLLNSKLCFYIFSKYYSGGGLGSTGIRFKKEFLSNLPLKQIVQENQQPFIEKADLMLTLNKELQEQSQKFQRNLQREFQLATLPKKLQDWYLLSYGDFIKELEKQKVKLSLSQKAEWEEYFTTEATKVKTIKTQIETTDNAIDKMVYELYGLSEEEVEIVEKS